jgi:hypothetical protein
LLAVVVGIGSGLAWAYFSSRGAGSGGATVGTAQAVTVLATTATPSTKLYPGTSADLVVEIKNPNSSAVTIVAVAGNGAVTPTGASGCTAANAGVAVANQTGLSTTVASGTDVTVHLPAAVAMSTASASSCQGASFQIPVSLTVQR